MKKSPFRLAALTVGLSLILTEVVPAQSTWTSATSGDWTNAANWTGGIPNASSAAAVFSNNWTGQLITNQAATVGQILATDTTSGGGVANAAVTITGGTLTLDNGASKAIISTGTNNAFSENSRFKIASVLDGTNGFERQGSGYLDLSGTVNLFTGTIVLNSTNSGGASFTVINSDANLGNATNTIQVGLGATATGFYNDGSAGAFTLNANRSIVTSGTGDFWVKNKSGANMTIAGVISGTARLRKNDGGTLTLSGTNTYTGGTLLDGGTLVLAGGNNRLLSGSTVTFNSASTLDVGNTSQTLGGLGLLGAGQMNTIRGTGGSLIFNATNDQTWNTTVTGTTVNMSNLSNFTFSRTNGAFQVNANAVSVTNTVFMARENNTFNADFLRWGGGGNFAGQNVLVRLGQTNSINVGSELLIGYFQGNGDVAFQGGLSTPSLTIRGAGGGANAAPLVRIGQANSGNQSTAGILNLTGGILDAIATQFDVGVQMANSGTTTGAGTLTMPAGTIVAETMSVGRKTATTGSPTVTGTVDQSGGSVTATTLYLGNSETAAGNNPNLVANYNLTGGTLFATTIGGNGANYGASTVRNLNVNGGTVRNKSGGDLAINGVASTATGRLNIVIGASGGTIEADAARNVSVGANALISGSGTLTKAGNGTLTINSASTHTGATTINAGRVALGAAAAISTNTLTFGGTSGTLDVGGNNQTVRTISITNASGANTVTGTGGSLTINGDANQAFGLGSGASFDFSGLDAFTFNRTNREFKFETVNVSGVALADINLAAGGVGGGTNTIAASFILVGGGNSAGSDGNTARLHLGTANTFNATSFRVGGFNAAGLVDFQSGLTGPSLTLRGADGVGAMTTWIIGETSSGTRNGSGVVNLTGGTLDALVTNMTIGRHVAGANNTDTSTFTISAGSLDATTLLMAEKSGTGAPTVTSTFNQLGGDVTVSTVTLGSDAGAGATARLLPTINIDGGTFKASTVQIGGGAFATNSARTLNIGAATLQNAAGTDLTVSSTNSTAGGRINVSLTGAATFEADAGRAITIGANTLLSGSGSLTKTGAGTLILSSGLASTNTGALNISNGVVNLAGSGVAAAGAVASVAVATSATLLLSQSDQVADNAAVTLSGGTIQRGAGVSEMFGDLTLESGSFLDYGSGATGTLQFGTYAPANLLTVQNFAQGNVLRFGSDVGSFLPTGGALTNSHFSFNNAFSYDSGSFTITAIPEPSTYLAAAGLVGLMLWSARRRAR